jgi:hypothetical protein
MATATKADILRTKAWVSNLFVAESQRLLWAALRAARGKIAISFVPNRLNCYSTCTIYRRDHGTRNTTRRAAGLETHALKTRLP